jgi:diguanylate cyclase (GGDEF)-like protein
MPLTGLPNRAVLLDRLTVAMANADRHRHRVGLLFVDLDKFKEINDTAGHAAGDEAINRVATILTSAVRAIDTVSRHGGDEFLILLSQIALPEDALVVAEKIGEALSRSSLEMSDQGLSASIGISVYPDHGADPKTLIERADKAMYSAKRLDAVSAVYAEDSGALESVGARADTVGDRA